MRRKLSDEHIMGNSNDFFQEVHKLFPYHWKKPKIDAWDGTTDPNDHANMYLSQLETQTNEYRSLCRAFLEHWKEIPTIALPSNSITNFFDLILKLDKYGDSCVYD